MNSPSEDISPSERYLHELKYGKPMSQQSELDDHIHMLGCQAITEAWNLGHEGKDPNDKKLMAMIEKHEKLLSVLLNKRIAEARIDELELAIQQFIFNTKKNPDNFSEYATARRKRLGDINGNV